MSGIFPTEEQQQNIHSVYTAGVFLLSIGNMSEINVLNITNTSLDNSSHHSKSNSGPISLLYMIILGFVCALLCFLTITGNLLVLITFRRMRTVSTDQISCYLVDS